MANNYSTDFIILDTFTSAVDLKTLRAANGSNALFGFAIESIEWQAPTTQGHTATILDGSTGKAIFDEVCVTANDSIIKHYNGKRFDNIYTAISAVQSGKIVIQLRGSRKG